MITNSSKEAGSAPGEPKLASLALPLAITFTVQAAVATVQYSAPVFAPAAAADFHVSPAAVGYFIAIAYAGSMLGTLAAGSWVARFGPIRVSQGGLAACFLGTVLAAAAPGAGAPALGLAAACLAAFVIGLGYGPTTPASSVVLARAAPPSLAAVTFSIKQTGVPVGGAIAGALLPPLVLLAGWRWGALAIGLACLALAVGCETVRRRYDTRLDPRAGLSPRRLLAPAALVLRDPAMAELAVVSLVYAGVQITLVTFLVTFLTEAFGVSLVLAGLVMAASQIASVVGRIAWGALADRLWTRRGVLGFLGVAMGLCALAMLVVSPAWPRWALFLLAMTFGATAVGWNGVFLAEVAHIAPGDKTSEATGGCLFFTYLGVVLTPLLFHALLAWTGNYAIPYAVCGAFALLTGARLLLVRRRAVPFP